MKYHQRWSIVFLKAESHGKGLPAVVLSSDDVMSNRSLRRCNVVVGVTGASSRAKEHQVKLDQTDGLPEPALIDCSLVHATRKSSILRAVGTVTVHRRQQIQQAVRAFLGLG